MARERLAAPLTGAQLERLHIFLDGLALWNRRVALVSRRRFAASVQKHVEDSLHCAAACPDGARIIDIGSGGGFPGLVIAAVRPAAHLVLVEPRRKKVSFLSEMIRQCGFEHVRLREQRIEQVLADAEVAQGFDILTSRALGSIEDLLTWGTRLLDRDGSVLAMKGPAWLAEAERAGPTRQGFRSPKVEEYRLSDGTTRVLLRYRRNVSRETSEIA